MNIYFEAWQGKLAKVRAIIVQMNKSSVGMAWSSNMALQSAVGVARLLGMTGDDVTRQINVHTQTRSTQEKCTRLSLEGVGSFAQFLGAFWLF